MARAYYSTVFDHTADEVWACIRLFGDYAWSGVEAVTVMEDGKSGDQVGAIRRSHVGDAEIGRQQLLAHSDLDRSYSYAICEPAYLPLHNFQATIRITPVVEDGKAFVEWWATFDCAEDALGHSTNHFTYNGFGQWLASLRKAMAERHHR